MIRICYSPTNVSGGVKVPIYVRSSTVHIKEIGVPRYCLRISVADLVFGEMDERQSGKTKNFMIRLRKGANRKGDSVLVTHRPSSSRSQNGNRTDRDQGSKGVQFSVLFRAERTGRFRTW